MTDQEKIKILRGVLERIAVWHGQFPETGQIWESSGRSMSYASCYGSNGERDFMRGLARQVLLETESDG